MDNSDADFGLELVLPPEPESDDLEDLSEVELPDFVLVSLIASSLHQKVGRFMLN